MIKWNAFSYNGITYDLSHLDPSTENYVQPAAKGKPARTYKVHVGYSHHCFTVGKEEGKQYDPLLLIRDPEKGEPGPSDVGRDTLKGDPRPFDVDRYTLSKSLPAIVGAIDCKKVCHTGNGKFFLVEIVGPTGALVEYEVYFKVYKAADRGWLDLYIHTAFVREQNKENRPKGKAISIFAIFSNVIRGKEPREPV